MDSEEREGVVIVRGAATGFAQEIIAGPHQFVSDEPTSAGGTDRGPTPYDLLLARTWLVHVHDYRDVRTA